jgi:hypothetical protein
MSPYILAVFLYIGALGAQTKAPPSKPVPGLGATALQDKETEAFIRAKLAKSKIGKDGFTVRVQGGVAYWDSLALVGELEPAADPLESLTAWRKTIGTTIPPELPAELNAAVQGGPGKKLEDDVAQKLRRYYLAVIARPVSAELEQARLAWEAARAARIIAEESAPGTFVFRDLPKPRESFIMLRGQYDKPGDKLPVARPRLFDIAQRKQIAVAQKQVSGL